VCPLVNLVKPGALEKHRVFFYMKPIEPWEECDCGSKPVKRNSNREPICERCDRLAKKSAIQIRYANDGLSKGRYVAKGRNIQNFQSFIESMKPSTLVDNAMSRLESMLNQLTVPPAGV